MLTKDRRAKNAQKSLNRSAKVSHWMNTFFEITKNNMNRRTNKQRPEDRDVPWPSSAKRPALINIDDDVLNESTETLVSNTLLNESHDCSLELDDMGNTADQNENSDDDVLKRIVTMKFMYLLVLDLLCLMMLCLTIVYIMSENT